MCVYLRKEMWYNKRYENKNQINRKISAERLERAMSKKQGFGKGQRDRNSWRITWTESVVSDSRMAFGATSALLNLTTEKMSKKSCLRKNTEQCGMA